MLHGRTKDALYGGFDPQQLKSQMPRTIHMDSLFFFTEITPILFKMTGPGLRGSPTREYSRGGLLSYNTGYIFCFPSLIACQSHHSAMDEILSVYNSPTTISILI
jgi:hypothetical protein